MSNDITARIMQILAALMNTSPERIDVAAEIAGMPGVDSLMMLRFVVKIEQEFSVRLDMAAVSNSFYSVETISRYLSSVTK